MFSCYVAMFSIAQKIDKAFMMKSGASFFIRIVSQGLSLAIAIMLTRLLSVEGFGLYALIVATVMITSVFVKEAALHLWTRFVATYMAEFNFKALKGALMAALLYALIAGMMLVLFLGSFQGVGEAIFAHFGTKGFLLALWLIPLSGMLYALTGILKGLNHVIWSQLPEFILRPLLFCLILLSFLFSHDSFEIYDAIAAYIISAFVALGFAFILLFRFLPQNFWNSGSEFAWKTWGLALGPLILTSGLMLVNQNADILMVGSLLGAEQAGLYQVATRTATLLLIVISSVNAIITPLLARHYAENDLFEMQRLITKASLLITLATVPLVIILTFAASYLLPFLYGDAYIASQDAFIYLIWAQAFNALAGPVGMVVIMTGRQKIGSLCIAASTIVNLGLNYILIPLYGIEGAAVATAVSILVWNILLSFFIWKDLKLNCTALPFAQYKK